MMESFLAQYLLVGGHSIIDGEIATAQAPEGRGDTGVHLDLYREVLRGGIRTIKEKVDATIEIGIGRTKIVGGNLVIVMIIEASSMVGIDGAGTFVWTGQMMDLGLSI